jgi:Family of unknown function (DUF6502)
MTREMHRRVLGACLQCLVPLARVLLKNGIGYREFEDACRRAFVYVAASEFGVRGRQTNASRIAAMTGLARKEVKKLKQQSVDDAITEVGGALSPLADLLHLWATSPEFADESGSPADLHFGSAGFGTFSELVRKSVRDVPPRAVRVELLRLGVVEELEESRLRLVRRSLIPPGSDERLASALTYSLRGLAETIAFNNDPDTARSDARFERFVESRPLSDHEISEIRAILKARLEVISEELDGLMDSEVGAPFSKDGRRIGVGLFYTE